MHHIWLYDDDITACGNEFFFSAGKLGAALPNKVDLKFAVPVHGRKAKFVWYPALVIAERLKLGTMHAVFPGISEIHSIIPF